MPESVSANIRDHLQSLEDVVTRRFQLNLGKLSLNSIWYLIPSLLILTQHRKSFQLELIDNHTVKEMFNAVTLVDFYKYLSANKFLCIKKFTGKGNKVTRYLAVETISD